MLVLIQPWWANNNKLNSTPQVALEDLLSLDNLRHPLSTSNYHKCCNNSNTKVQRDLLTQAKTIPMSWCNSRTHNIRSSNSLTKISWRLTEQLTRIAANHSFIISSNRNHMAFTKTCRWWVVHIHSLAKARTASWTIRIRCLISAQAVVFQREATSTRLTVGNQRYLSKRWKLTVI